jgi:hypothetical protein
MPVLGPARSAARFRILVLAAAGLGLVLLWGCWLIYGAGIGTDICKSTSPSGLSPLLSQWCDGNSWRGWLGSCLAIAATLFAAGVGLALGKTQAAWLVPSTLLSAVAVWLGFVLPQEVAGADIHAAQPTPNVAPAQPYGQTPAAPPPPSPLERAAPSVLPSARPIGLGQNIFPTALFGCPRDQGTVESVVGPGTLTNFNAVRVQRGPRGLCATFTSPQISTFAVPQEETRVVSLTFTPRTPVGSTRRPTPNSFSVEVWAADQGRVYALILRPSSGEAQTVTVGNLGLARGHLSILIEQPTLPNWILGRKSSWNAQLT